MNERRRVFLAGLLGTTVFARPAMALRVEPAPTHVIAAHGSAVAARRRHAALIAAVRTELIARGDDPATVDALIGEYRCPDCDALAQS